MGQKRSGFSQSKKYDKYVTEVDHPVAQKTENSHKRRNPKGHSKDLENQKTSPKDVRCIRGLAYFMKDQVIEIKEKSRDILEESEHDQEKTQRRRPTCPPGFSDLPPLPSYNVEKGMSSLIITDCEQDQEKPQGGGLTCPPGFSDIPQAPKDNIEEEEKVKLPKAFEDIIQHLGREYSTDLFCKNPVEIPNSMVGYTWF